MTLMRQGQCPHSDKHKFINIEDSRHFRRGFLRFVDHDGDGVITVYSSRVAIGGLFKSERDQWFWAVFAVQSTVPAVTEADEVFGGVEDTKDDAVLALELRWSRWLASAGLTPWCE